MIHFAKQSPWTPLWVRMLSALAALIGAAVNLVSASFGYYVRWRFGPYWADSMDLGGAVMWWWLKRERANGYEWRGVE